MDSHILFSGFSDALCLEVSIVFPGLLCFCCCEECLRCVCVYVCLKCVDKIDGGSRTEAEEKVYSWLYALAQSDKDLVFEYVRSTERGEYFVFIV